MTKHAAQSGHQDEGFARYRWAMLGGIWLIYYSFGVVAGSMAPLVSRISQDLDIDFATMGAIMGAWPLMYIFAAIPCGLLLDRLQPRLAMFIGGVLIAASCLGRAWAFDGTGMFISVALFGVGGPLISIGAPKLITLWFDGPNRGLAMGVYITGPALGTASALALTNAILLPWAGEDWRLVMQAFAAMTLLTALVWFVIASHPLAGATLAKSEPAAGFELSSIPAILKLPAVQALLAMAVCIFFINHGLNNWLPEVLRSKGFSAADAGFWASMPTMVGIASSLIVPRLAVPSRRMAVMSAIFGAVLIASLLLQAQSGAVLVFGLVLLGIARGSMMALAMQALMETPGVPRAQLGLAGGLFFVAAELGGVLGPVTMGVFFDKYAGFYQALMVLAGVALVLVFLTALLARINRKNR
nr:MFS transporter [Amylibacter sp.]